MTLRFTGMDRSHEQSIHELAIEFREEGDDRFDPFLNDVNEFFENVEQFEHDRALPPDRVPMTHYMLFDEARLLGMSRLRRRLIPVLMLDGGHIGYEVRPSERRKGYASELLRRTLEEARGLALDRVLLTASKANQASIRVIERAGGIRDSDSVSPRTGDRMRRFWIDL